MKFDLNNFLLAVSFALDYIEKDVFGLALNHGKRVAYDSLMLGKRLGMDEDDLADLVSLAVLHDNGLSEYISAQHARSLTKPTQFENVKDHCIIGEKNVENYPFLREEKTIILYHHEKLDGSGLFHLKGSEIPLKAQIISFADYIDIKFDSSKMYGEYKNRVKEHIVKLRDKKFSPAICDAFFDEINRASYRLDQEDGNIVNAINRYTPQKYMIMDYKRVREISMIFSRIIDAKSKFTGRHSKGLSEKAGAMAAFYHYSEEKTIKLHIAADLHDLGKLLIANDILEAERKLTTDEFAKIQSHTYYTRVAMERISGFEDITEWAANHHEKLNGKGYPYGLTAKDLDFNSRLLGCLDIYQALTEDRPYRSGMGHLEGMKIMTDMADGGFIDKGIVRDIGEVFAYRERKEFE